MKTTLNKIRAHSPCKEGWEKLLKYLRKTKSDDEPLSLLTILDSNGLDDALWCMKAVDGRDKEIRLYAVWCARQVQHLIKDPRSLVALDVAERFANGEATKEELAEAEAAAMDARDSAYVEVSDATWNAASAAMDSAYVEVSDATWNAANDAAMAAAMYAGSKACYASRVAWDAARDAARVAQEARLREVCNEVQGEDK